MANLFEQAAKSAQKTKTTKEKKTVEVTDKNFDKNLQLFANLKAQIDALTAQMDVVKDELKPVVQELFVKEFQETGVYPESFNVKSKSGAITMFITSDKYPKLTDETFEFLEKKYKKSPVVEKIIEFSLNTELVQKHGPAISRAIEKCKEISDEDKLKLIKATETIQVKKGSISRAFVISKESGVKLPEVVSDLSCVQYFKDPKLG